MKLGLNGALRIGTLDGANVEVPGAVGAENFGHAAEQLAETRAQGYDPWNCYNNHRELRAVLGALAGVQFSSQASKQFRPLLDSLMASDRYFLLADFAGYMACQTRGRSLLDPEAWSRSAILNVANMGELSSDRTVRDYAECILGVVSSRDLTSCPRCEPFAPDDRRDLLALQLSGRTS